MKQRGINVATFGDDQSPLIWLQVLVVLILYFAMQVFIFVVIVMRQNREDKWEAYFECLAEYNAVKGNTKVPTSYSDDLHSTNSTEHLKLGIWVRSQKRRQNKLSDDQVDRLNELGFEWN